MNYADARRQIHDGDIVFMRDAKGVAGWTIRLATGSPYSHVGMAFWMTTAASPDERLMIIESAFPKPRIENLSSYAETNMDVVCAPRPWPDVAEWMFEQQDTQHYGVRDLYRIALRERLNWTWIGDPKGQVCSELMAKGLNHAGMRLTAVPSPGKLFHELLLRGHKLRCEIRA